MMIHTINKLEKMAKYMREFCNICTKIFHLVILSRILIYSRIFNATMLDYQDK